MLWLLRKDSRELVASRAFWLMLLVVGLLVGHAFLTAVATYAELSGAGGGTAVLAQGLSPLDGIIVPTFAAYGLAATLLLPFVGIRLVAAERENGALNLLLQARTTRIRIMSSKAIVLLAAWIGALLPGFGALVLWSTTGGHLAPAEVAIVVLGHLFLAAITIGVACVAGSLARNAASGAIIALTITLGAWAVDFMAAVQGGALREMARYTPSAVLRTFEHGELRVATVLISIVVVLGGIILGSVAIDVGSPLRSRAMRWTVALVLSAVVSVGFSMMRSSVDLTEDRRNSFPPEHERALKSISSPLNIEVHLAGEDPRRVDLERELLARLRRAMPVNVRYVEGEGTGMTSRSEHYGEMVYSIGARQDTTRSVIVPVVLEMIYRLAGIPEPETPADESAYPGYPNARRPQGITLIFFVIWPLLVLAAWRLSLGREERR